MSTSGQPVPPRARRGLRAVAVAALVACAVPTGAATGAWSAPPDRPAVYRLPVDGPVRVVRAFDPPPEPWLAGHRGVDVSADVGTTVRAPADGAVAYAGDVAGRGVVTVVHDDGRRSSLEPVRATVDVGARVAAGDPLGTLAGTAHGAAHGGLHWGVREGDRYVDPWGLLPDRGPVVLLPLP